MWQGETAVRAERVSIDQSKGDFVGSGNATSTIVLDTGGIRRARGRHPLRRHGAHDCVSSMPNAAGTITAQAQLSGPQGDLRADRIQVILAPTGGHITRLEAYTNVSLKLDTRSAVGERLTYFAEDDRYLMSGAGTKAVKVIESCRETTGRTLVFFKSTDPDHRRRQRRDSHAGRETAPAPAAPRRHQRLAPRHRRLPPRRRPLAPVDVYASHRLSHEVVRRADGSEGASASM
jgi:lipopolysaccharide export system protein LptA